MTPETLPAAVQTAWDDVVGLLRRKADAHILDHLLLLSGLLKQRESVVRIGCSNQVPVQWNCGAATRHDCGLHCGVCGPLLCLSCRELRRIDAEIEGLGAETPA